MNNQSLVIAFVPDPYADYAAEYWLKMLQVGIESDAATLSDAANLIDSAYDTSVCGATADVSTGGKEAATDDQGNLIPPVDEQALYTIAKGVLKFNVCANQNDCRTVQVKVYRSHSAEPCKIILDNGSITQTSTGSEEISEQAVVTNAAGYNLQFPLSGPLCYGWSTVTDPDTGGAIPVPVIKTEASTLKFGRNITALLDLQYQADYDLLEITIPNKADGSMGDCNLLAYYHGMVFTCQIKEPPVDPSMTVMDARNLCLGVISDVDMNYKAICYEEVHHAVLCQCSGSESTRSWDSEENVPCPGEYKTETGRFRIGSRSVTEGYTDCGETTQVHDPAYYQQVCCIPQHVALPKCVVSMSAFGGGKGISGGIQQALNTYGPNTKMVSVGPRSGKCGVLTLRQVVPTDSCCDVTPPIQPQANNPTSIAALGATIVSVFGGKVILKWEVTGGHFDGGKNVLYSGDRWKRITSDGCPACLVKISDGCTQLTVFLPVTGFSVLQIVDKQNRVVAPNGYIHFEAEDGIPPYYWGSDKLAYIGNGTFQAPGDFCGSASVTVTDACTSMDICQVRSTDGYWKDITSTISGYPCSGVSSAGGTVLSVSQGRAQVELITGNLKINTSVLFSGTLNPNPCPLGNDLGSLQAVCTAIYAGGVMQGDRCCYLGNCNLKLMESIDAVSKWVCAGE